jgi:hypothetical protein
MLLGFPIGSSLASSGGKRCVRSGAEISTPDGRRLIGTWRLDMMDLNNLAWELPKIIIWYGDVDYARVNDQS